MAGWNFGETQARALVMDLATIARVHELAAAYGGVGLDKDEKNLLCP